MFSSIVQLGQVWLRGKKESVRGPSAIIMGLLTSPCLWVIPICDFPWPFSANVRRRVSSWPHKKGPKCLYRSSLIRKQRCVRPCHSSSIHILLSWCLQICNHSLFSPFFLWFSLCMCCKYTIPCVEVRGMRGWWRAGPVIFLQLLKLQWPMCTRVALCQRVFHVLLTNYLSWIFICCLLTHNHRFQAPCGVYC